MRIFKTAEFSRNARKENVTDAELLKAAERAIKGKIDADLGAYLIKQRVSQGEGGRSGSYRAIIVHKKDDRIVFVHLYGKNEKANLTPMEKGAYRKLAKLYADLASEFVEPLLRSTEWIEIEHEEDEIPK